MPRTTAAATATARADEPPSPDPAGTFDCVLTRIPLSTPRARRIWATRDSVPDPRISETSFPSAFCRVSFDSILTPLTPVSTRHQARRSTATFTVTAPGWKR